jgi:hypothetical protein
LENKDWLFVNQSTAAENKHTGRPDVILCIDGLVGFKKAGGPLF